MTSRIKSRRDSAANWAGAGAAIVPGDGEPCVVRDPAGTGSPLFKIGDAIRNFGTLPYAASQFTWSAGGQSGYAPIANPIFTGNMSVAGNLTVGGTSIFGGNISVTGKVTQTVVTMPTAGGELVVKAVLDLVCPIGVMWDFAGPTLPANFVWCDGQAYGTGGAMADLFAVIGYTYGGGGPTFNVPDTRGLVLIGQTFGATVNGINAALAATGGAATHSLALGEIPAHTHTYAVSNSTVGGSGIPAASSGAFLNNQTTGSAGTGGAHNNVQPYLAANKIIRFV